MLACAPLAAQEAAVATEIAPGKSKSVRLRSLPQGAVVAVRVTSSGRLGVALVGVKHLKEPKPDSKPLFRGVVQDKLSFRVTIPEADDYLLVLNNRAGQETLKVEVEMRASRGRSKPAPRDHAPRPEKASLKLICC